MKRPMIVMRLSRVAYVRGVRPERRAMKLASAIAGESRHIYRRK